MVGIGAVKYSDFSNNRTTDYVFSFDKMLAMEGNTAPYMQYACARVNSIERKAAEKGIDVAGQLADAKQLVITEAPERELAIHLLKYGQAITAAAAEFKPNYLTTYLYELAQKFSAFYTNCPVLSAGEDKMPTRLMLCKLTHRTLSHGLEGLLRIDVPEQM
jgi:arginyl-tRNA synthetase